MTEHRHPRCVTPARGVAPSDAQTIAELRREVGDLKLQHEAVVADRDALLESWGRATEALGLPEGHEVDKVIAELEGKRCISGDACECLECEVRLLRRLRNADRTEWMTTYETMRAELARLSEELSHATAAEGDWLSKASRAMCSTMLGDRDALRAQVRDLEAWGRNEVERANATADHVIAERDARIAELEAALSQLLAARNPMIERVAALEKLLDEYRHEDVGAFADGELSPERADGFRLHLATCEACEAALGGLVQQAAILSTGEPK
jgi:hypothetical protein